MASFAQDQNIGMKRVQTLTGDFTRKGVKGWVLSSLIRQQERGWRLKEVWPCNIRSTSADTDRQEESNEEVEHFNWVNDATWSSEKLQKHRREQLSFYLWSPVARNNQPGQEPLIDLETEFKLRFY